MKRAVGIIALAVLTACGSETSGSPSAGEFPTEGPHSTVREDTNDFIYFFPESLDDAPTWPALVWFNGLSGYTEDWNYNGLLESIASWGFVVIGGKHSGMNPAEVDLRTELLRRNDDPQDALFGKPLRDVLRHRSAQRNPRRGRRYADSLYRRHAQYWRIYYRGG